MRVCAIILASFALALALGAPSATAKEGVKATVLSPVSASANAGAEIQVTWLLADGESGEPFNACAVFVRLIGPTGDSTEAFAECGVEASKGKYKATPVVPNGGVKKIEIGVAGTVTNRDGQSRRSDWLMPLRNDPIVH